MTAQWTPEMADKLYGIAKQIRFDADEFGFTEIMTNLICAALTEIDRQAAEIKTLKARWGEPIEWEVEVNLNGAIYYRRFTLKDEILWLVRGVRASGLEPVVREVFAEHLGPPIRVDN